MEGAVEGWQGCRRQPGRREAAQAADGKEMARGMDGSGERH